MNITKIDYLVRPWRIYRILRPLLQFAAYCQWVICRAPPPPLCIKAKLIQKLRQRYNIDILVETGTFFGDMIDLQIPYFRELLTIELDQKLANLAKDRFSKVSKVKVLEGDSGLVIPKVLENLKQPALFWLDGHFSGGVTARGNCDTPIIKELSAIFESEHIPHIILIDDARLFGTSSDYPILSELEEQLRQERPTYSFSIIDDMICMLPPQE